MPSLPLAMRTVLPLLLYQPRLGRQRTVHADKHVCFPRCRHSCLQIGHLHLRQDRQAEHNSQVVRKTRQ